MDHMPEASSSTSPPPVVHQATFVFDSGLSREHYVDLIENNGIVRKIVQRLMQKSGNHEQSLRLGLIITAQEAPYHNPRALHSVIPAHRQDFRRPSAFLSSLPALVRHFAPHAALNPPKPGSILSDIWDIEDGGGLSISANEPGLSDRFLSGLVGGLELLEHHSLPNSVPPPNALQQMTPDSGLHMLSMYYAPQRSQAQEPKKQYLVVFTDKASLASIDADSRGLSSWAREDSSASYDDVDWDNIGDRCRAQDVACSCVILGSPESGRSTAPLGRDGSTAEKLRKMCQTSSSDGPDDAWFTLPPDSDVYLTGMPVRTTASPPPPVPAPPETKPATTPTAATAGNGLSEAQIKYQLAQKQAMSAKMAQAAQGGQGAGGFNVLAQLISSGRLDPTVMTQLAGSIRSDDPGVRQKAMQQLSALVMQAQNKQANPAASAASNGGDNKPLLPSSAAPTAAGAASTNSNPAGPAGNTNIPNVANPSTLSQQQQFVAAMQARQRAMQAHANQMNVQQQSQLNQMQGQGNQQGNTAGNSANATQGQPQQAQAQQQAQSHNQAQGQGRNQQQQANQNQQQTAQQLQNQQQALLLQRQQQLAAQQQQQQQQQQQGGTPQNNNNGQQNNPEQMRQPIWSGTISWVLKGHDRCVIPVQCALLSQQMNMVDLMLNQWPQNLEMSAMTPMNMGDLQNYVKTHQAPCVLFNVAPQASQDLKGKMGYLAASLASKQLAAFIKFGNPGCGILLVSASRGPQTPGSEQANRLLGVVCLKQPFQPMNPAGATTSNTTMPMGSVTINGGPVPGGFNNIPSISPQFLQQAQLQSQLLQNQQNQPARVGTPGQPGGHTRTPSQGNITTPNAQGRIPTTLQQFANQPNMQTIQQLQMRQLQATGGPQPQPLQQPQQPQPQPQPQQGQNNNGVRPPGNNISFTDQQKAGIIKLLRDANLNISDNFDPNQIPREALASIINQAKEKAKQAQAAAMLNKPQQAPPQQQQQQQQQGLGQTSSLGLNSTQAQAQAQAQAANMNLPAGYNNFMQGLNFNNMGSNLAGLNMAQLAQMGAMSAMQNQNQQGQGQGQNQQGGMGGMGPGGLGGGLGQQGGGQQGGGQQGGGGGGGGGGQLNAAALASLGQIPGFNLQQFQAAQAAQQSQNQSALGLFAAQGGLNPAMLSQFQQQH